QAPLHSRLVKQGTTVVEQVYRLPAAAEALERALPSCAPPQRAVFEPLSAFFRSGDPAQFDAAARAWTETFGLVDGLAGFFDRSADPRGRKALFGAMVGLADPERTDALERLQLRNSGEALFLLSAHGALRPPQTYALTLDGKSALFASALEAAAHVRADPAIAALAEPQRAVQLQVWWFTGKGAVIERHSGGRRSLSVPDGGRFRAAAQELVALLNEVRTSNDAARWRELIDRHGSQVDPRWRAEASGRLAGVPRRVAVLPPRLEPVLEGGKVVDAQATAVQDLDEQILRDWAAY